MSFLYPWFLLALSAISIPIIIHLFHFRRFKKVYFSNISFLERLSDETQKQARLKHLLVLISRILAIALLVFAFARPYIPLHYDGQEVTESNKLSLFIDNSFSMEAGSAYGTLFDEARETAREIVQAFNPTDQFQLLTNDFEGRHQRFVSRDDFLRLLDEVSFSPSVRKLSEVVQRQQEIIQQEPGREQKHAFILSDFQKNVTDFEQTQPDSTFEYYFIPFSSPQPANLFIDSVWIDNPVRMSGQAISLQVRIFNDSDEQLENQPVRLYVNGAQRSVATFDIRPGAYAEVALTYTLDRETLQRGYVEINDHPVTFDDRFYFSFQLSENIPVLAINQQSSNRFLNALLASDTTFTFTNMNVGSIDYASFVNQNLIILNELEAIGGGLSLELQRYVEDGGNLLVFPAENMDFTSFNEFLAGLNVNGYAQLDTQSTRVTAINELHHIYTGVFDHIPENIDLPSVEQYFILEQQARGQQEYLMQLQNGNEFFVSAQSGQGQVFLSTVPANDQFSNFPRHAMFVPTVYNIALHSASFHPLYYTLGVDELVSVRDVSVPADKLFAITGDELEVIPEVRTTGNLARLFLHGQIRDAGNYALESGDHVLRMLSFNYDRRESLLESYTSSEINSFIGSYDNVRSHVIQTGDISFERQLETARGGRQLWKAFLFMGLLFLFAEVLLLRFWK